MSIVIQKQILDFVDNRMTELAEEIYEAQMTEAIDAIENYVHAGPVQDLILKTIKELDMEELANAEELKSSLDELYGLMGSR